jgi:hypothetical protein
MPSMSLYTGNHPTVSSSGARLPAALRRDLTTIQERAVVQTARVQAHAYVAAEAMYAVLNLSELEGQLATMSPLATSRLEFLANAATMRIAQIVNNG